MTYLHWYFPVAIFKVEEMWRIFIDIFLSPFLKLSRCDIFLHWYFPVAIFKVENLRYDVFLHWHFYFENLRRCDVFADARWHFNKGAASPPNHLSDLSQKRSVQILQNFAGNLSYLWRHIFLDKKSMVCLILLMLFLAIDFFTISFQKVGGLVQKEKAESKDLHCHCTRL